MEKAKFDLFLALGRSGSRGFRAKLILIGRNLIGSNNSRFVGTLARSSLNIWVKLTGKPPTGFHRAVASYCQPHDPLRRSNGLPAIDLIIPAATHDVMNLGLVLNFARANIRNPIASISVVTPLTDRQKATSIARYSDEPWEKLKREIGDFELFDDEEILGRNLFEAILDLEPRVSGWELQQLIKIEAVRKLSKRAALVLDSDTLLISRKTWMNSQGRQLLHFSEEYHQPYRNLMARFFSLRGEFPVSFVTHHQLMQKELLLELFPREDSSLGWLIASRSAPSVKLSEYETYGHHLLEKHSSRVAFGNWGNLWSPHLDQFLGNKISSDPNFGENQGAYNSISFHSHSQRRLRT